jgi:hypothetical protein
MKRPIHLIVRFALLLSVLLSGCAATGSASPPRPARISHIVFFKLHEPALWPDLLADCDRLLPSIPGVVSYAAGRHLDTGRGARVVSDYDLGLYIGFDSEPDYAGYVDHPAHRELVGTWQPRLAWLRVYDVLDDSP